MELNFATNSVGQTKYRVADLHGRKHYVVPMALITPGVLNGSKGPLLYPHEEVHRNINQWNGMPLTLGHPYENGSPVSARSAGVLNKYSLGTVLNSRISKSGKLAADGWFDVELTRQRAPEIISAIEQGQSLELSTGLFTENVLAANGSQHNGKSYDHIAKNYKADHVAILLHEKGACSLKDGCGVLVDNINQTTTEEPTDNAWSEASRIAAILARRVGRTAKRLVKTAVKKKVDGVKSEVQRVRDAIAKKGQGIVDKVAGKKPTPPPLPQRKTAATPPPLPQKKNKPKPPPLPQKKDTTPYGVKEAETQGKRSAVPEAVRVKRAVKKVQARKNPRRTQPSISDTTARAERVAALKKDIEESKARTATAKAQSKQTRRKLRSEKAKNPVNRLKRDVGKAKAEARRQAKRVKRLERIGEN